MVFFRQEIAIDRAYPRGSFHLKIREVRGWCVPQLDPTGVLEIFVPIERSGATCSYIGTCQKKSRERQPQVGHVQHYLEKESFC